MEMSGFTKEKKNEHMYKYIKTAALFFSWICQGLYNEVIGPTLLDLMDRVGCNHEEISRVLSARSAGLFLGSLIGGVIHDKWARHRDVIIAASLLLSAIAVTVLPWCSTLWMLGVFFHLMGHGHGLLSTGGNPTIAVLWHDKSEGPYQLLHMGFGVGAILGILISQPFISGGHLVPSVQLSANESLPLYDDNYTINTTTFEEEDNFEISRIEYPYMIAGVLCTLASAIFLAYYFRRTPPQYIPKQSRWRDVFNPRRCSGGQTVFGIQMLLLIFVFFMFIVGLERGFGKFIFSFVVKSELELSTHAASWLSMFFWVSYTIGRLTSFVLVRCIPPHRLLFIQILGAFSATILLNIFSYSGNAVIGLTVMFGFFMSQIYPTCLGWANRYIEISSMTTAIIDSGSSTGGMMIQWLTGYMFQYYGSHTFLYVMVSLSAAVLVIFLIMHLVASRHGERFSLPNIAPYEINGLIDPLKEEEKCKKDSLNEDEKCRAVEGLVAQSA